MAKGGGGGGGGEWMLPNAQQVFPIFLEDLILQTKVLAVGLSLGHLSMRIFYRLDLPSCL